MKTKRSYLSILCLFFVSPVALQAMPVYEGFPSGSEAGQYPPGADPATVSGIGDGWAQASWKNSNERKMIASAAGLEYSDETSALQTTPGGVWSPDASGNAELIRDFPETGSTPDVWFSVIMDRDPIAAGYEDRFEFQFRSHTNGLKYAIQAKDGSQAWHVSYVPVKPAAADKEEKITAELPGTKYDESTLFVGKIEKIATDNTVLKIWANPKDLQNPGDPIWTSPAFSGQNFGRVALVSDGTRVGTFDEIRFGSSFAEVVPLKQAGFASR